MSNAAWPELPYEAWKDTYAALHMWTQVVGKVRLALMPWLNHCWQVTLYPTASGLTTGPMPHAGRSVQIDFDFVAHRLLVRASDGRAHDFALAPMAVADFYHAVMRALDDVGVSVSLYTRPCEIEAPIAFDADVALRPYDADAVNRCWRIVGSAARVFTQFRARFYGKASPVHFFWGAFDLAVTRFSGRIAPPHPGGVPNLPDRVTRDAYSHEVSSCGFWPGADAVPYALFYSYAYPEPAGFAQARVGPEAARYDTTLREFVLPYDAVRAARDPDTFLLEFLQSTYEAAANAAAWDRAKLEAPVTMWRSSGDSAS